MGLKEWLNKPRLSDESWREQMAFVGKGLALCVAAGWTATVGTDWTEKRAKALDASSVPIAEAHWSAPVMLSKPQDDGWCRINGQYGLLNVGELAYRIEEVRLELYRLPIDAKPAVVDGQTYPAKIGALNNAFADLAPYVAANIKVGEMFSQKARMEKSFILEFEVPQDVLVNEQFVLTAKAMGGIPETDNWMSSLLELVSDDYRDFKPNDLRITTSSFYVYLNGCTSPSGFDNQGDLILNQIAIAEHFE